MRVCILSSIQWRRKVRISSIEFECDGLEKIEGGAPIC